MIPRRAMVLAAGLGTRMRPLTENRPKALVEVAGKPLVDWTLDKLAAAGVETAVVNAHHFADDLERHLLRRHEGPSLVISDEREELLDTGGALAKAAEHLGDEPIFVCNIDSVWSEPTDKPGELERLAAAYDRRTMDTLFLLAALEATAGFSGKGDFFINSAGRIEPRGDRNAAPYAYAGVHILNPKRLHGFEVKPFSLWEVWRIALAEHRAYGHEMSAFWMHVGDPAAREAAEDRLMFER